MHFNYYVQKKTFSKWIELCRYLMTAAGGGGGKRTVGEQSTRLSRRRPRSALRRPVCGQVKTTKTLSLRSGRDPGWVFFLSTQTRPQSFLSLNEVPHAPQHDHQTLRRCSRLKLIWNQKYSADDENVVYQYAAVSNIHSLTTFARNSEKIHLLVHRNLIVSS